MAQTIIDKANPEVRGELEVSRNTLRCGRRSCLYLLTMRTLLRLLDLVLGDGERSEATQTDGNSRDEIKLFVLFSIILPLSLSSYNQLTYSYPGCSLPIISNINQLQLRR